MSSIKEGWFKDFSNAPNFRYADLYNYMIMKPGYDQDGLKAYKGLHWYKLCEAGHVVNFKHVQIKDSRHSFVRFKVLPLFCIAHPYCARFFASLARPHPEHNKFLMRLSSSEKRIAIYS